MNAKLSQDLGVLFATDERIFDMTPHERMAFSYRVEEAETMDDVLKMLSSMQKNTVQDDIADMSNEENLNSDEPNCKLKSGTC